MSCPYKVRGLVQDNLQKLVDRGDRLDDLGEKAGTHARPVESTNFVNV